MMAPLSKNNSSFSQLFLLAALCLLIIGMLFGLTGGLQYIIPGFLIDHLSFEKVRPLHVSSVVFWIIIGAMGSALTYLQEHTKLGNTCRSFSPFKKTITAGYLTANISLFVFWIALIIAGIIKARWQMSINQIPFGSMMKMLAPYLITFVVAGFFMVTGFMMVLYPLLKNQIACYFSSEKNINSLPSKKIKVAVSFEM